MWKTQLPLLKEARKWAYPNLVHLVAVDLGVALRLTDELRKQGVGIDRELVQASALLHDCARREPNHARAGEKALRLLGFPEVAVVVGQHMDLQEPESGEITAAQLVYLADKLVEGDRRVSLEERFEEKRRRLADQPRVLEKIGFRLQVARIIQKRLETVFGRPLEKVLGTSEHPDKTAIHHE